MDVHLDLRRWRMAIGFLFMAMVYCVKVIIIIIIVFSDRFLMAI